ncbi:hypothetical protein ACKWTF_014937 [Chironomus riparius]
MNLQNYLRSSIIIFILHISSTSGKLPPYIKICSQNDPNIEQCIVDSVMSLQPLLRSGKLVEDYQMPSIEPFTYDDLTIDHGPGFRIELKDLKSWNGSNFEIVNAKVNLEKLTFDFTVTMPNVKMIGKYKMTVKLPLIELSGNGELINLLKNSRMRIKLYASKVEEEGKSFIKFNKANVRFHKGDSQITLTNLFNGDPTLTRIGNQIVNDNQDLFAAEVMPVLEAQFSKIFMEVANKIVENSTFDEIMPP